MKISPLIVLLVGALVGALAWGQCNAGRASDAQIRLETALREHGDSLAQWQVERSTLSLARDSLQAKVGPLRQAYEVSRVLGRRGRDSVAKLLALLPDSQRAPLETAITIIGNVGERCSDLLVNCEQRAANAEARAHGDSTQLFTADSLLKVTEASWHTAERRAQPSFFRDLWRSRKVTLPLAAVTTFLLLTHR